MPYRDGECLSVLPLMIYRAQGGRRLTMEETIAFVAQYKEHCDSLKNAPMDRIFEYTDAASRLSLKSEEVSPPEMEPEERRQHVAKIFERIAREIRS